MIQALRFSDSPQVVSTVNPQVVPTVNRSGVEPVIPAEIPLIARGESPQQRANPYSGNPQVKVLNDIYLTQYFPQNLTNRRVEGGELDANRRSLLPFMAEPQLRLAVAEIKELRSTDAFKAMSPQEKLEATKGVLLKYPIALAAPPEIKRGAIFEIGGMPQDMVNYFAKAVGVSPEEFKTFVPVFYGISVDRGSAIKGKHFDLALEGQSDKPKFNNPTLTFVQLTNGYSGKPRSEIDEQQIALQLEKARNVVNPSGREQVVAVPNNPNPPPPDTVSTVRQPFGDATNLSFFKGLTFNHFGMANVPSGDPRDDPRAVGVQVGQLRTFSMDTLRDNVITQNLANSFKNIQSIPAADRAAALAKPENIIKVAGNGFPYPEGTVLQVKIADLPADLQRKLLEATNKSSIAELEKVLPYFNFQVVRPDRLGNAQDVVQVYNLPPPSENPTHPMTARVVAVGQNLSPTATPAQIETKYREAGEEAARNSQDRQQSNPETARVTPTAQSQSVDALRDRRSRFEGELKFLQTATPRQKINMAIANPNQYLIRDDGSRIPRNDVRWELDAIIVRRVDNINRAIQEIDAQIETAKPYVIVPPTEVQRVGAGNGLSRSEQLLKRSLSENNPEIARLIVPLGAPQPAQYNGYPYGQNNGMVELVHPARLREFNPNITIGETVVARNFTYGDDQPSAFAFADKLLNILRELDGYIDSASFRDSRDPNNPYGNAELNNAFWKYSLIAGTVAYYDQLENNPNISLENKKFLMQGLMNLMYALESGTPYVPPTRKLSDGREVSLSLQYMLGQVMRSGSEEVVAYKQKYLVGQDSVMRHYTLLLNGGNRNAIARDPNYSYIATVPFVRTANEVAQGTNQLLEDLPVSQRRRAPPYTQDQIDTRQAVQQNYARNEMAKYARANPEKWALLMQDPAFSAYANQLYVDVPWLTAEQKQKALPGQSPQDVSVVPLSVDKVKRLLAKYEQEWKAEPINQQFSNRARNNPYDFYRNNFGAAVQDIIDVNGEIQGRGLLEVLVRQRRVNNGSIRE